MFHKVFMLLLTQQLTKLSDFIKEPGEISLPLHPLAVVKEAPCRFGEEIQTQNLNICNINEEIRQTLFQ